MKEKFPTDIVIADQTRNLQATMDFASKLACPRCHGALDTAAAIVVSDGRVKSGVASCNACRERVATISGYRYDFLRFNPGSPRPSKTLTIAPEWERRIPGFLLTDNSGPWRPEGNFLMVDHAGSRIRFKGYFTDASVRFMQHSWSGMVELWCDGALIREVDLYSESSAPVAFVQVASDLPMGVHQVELVATGRRNPQAQGGQVWIQELILMAPEGTMGFSAPQAVNYGNPHTEFFSPYMALVPRNELILECGGGDRRSADGRIVNMEYLPFELANLYADLHSLPWADNSFAAVTSQAVFEHLYHPFKAAQEIMRITRPGGVILTEVAFLQPLHGVPSHYFNMTIEGVKVLFPGCEVLQEGYFGDFTQTINWMIKVARVRESISGARQKVFNRMLQRLDNALGDEGRRYIASGVQLAVRKPA